MNNIDNNELKQIKSQITDIHNAMNVSSSTFKLLYDAKNFWVFFLVNGIFSVLIPLFYHILILIYDSHNLIPNYMKIVFYFCIFICWAILMLIRTKISLNIVKKLKMKLNLWSMFKQLLSTKMWIAVIPIIGIAVALLIHYSSSLTMIEYVAFSGVTLGLVLNIIGVMLNQKEYIIAGFWLMLVGLVVVFWWALPAHIAFAVIFSPASFLFVVAARITSISKSGQDDAI